MSRLLPLVMTLAAFLGAQPTVAAVTVTSPAAGATVCAQHIVQGTANGPILDQFHGDIWVVVHPLRTSDYWVQTLASADSNGDWQSYANFGEPGQHVGLPYELKAVIGPATPLHTGQKLPQWPNAAEISSLVSRLVRGAC